MIQQYARRGASALGHMFKEKQIHGQVTSIQRAPRHLSYTVKLSNPANLKQAVSITEETAMGGGFDSVIVRRYRNTLVYDLTLPKDSGLWKTLRLSDTTGNNVGVAAGNIPIPFKFDIETHPNWLVAGEMGSGKSVSIATAILSQCRVFTPDRFKFGLIDPHQDKYYAPFKNAEHLVGKPAVEATEIKTLIQWFHAQLETRKKMGQTKFEQLFNDGKEARLVLVIDEASRLQVLGSGKNLNKDNQALVRDIVQEGRKFCVNVVLGTQKPMEDELPGIFSLIGSRMVGYVSTSTMSTHVTGQGGAGAHLLTGKGDFLRVHGGSVNRFLWAYPGEEDYGKLPRVEDYKQLVVPERGTITIAPTAEPGRPVTQLDMKVLGWYLLKPPSVRKAKEKFDVGYTLHKRYKAEAEQLIATLKEIKGKKNQ